MLHPYTALVWGMGASLALFLCAYAVRAGNKRWHQLFAIAGVVFNLASSVYLIYAVRILAIEMPTEYSFTLISAHRIFATLVALMMLMMLLTGLRRSRRLHVALHRFFLPGYILTYISGLVLFHR